MSTPKTRFGGVKTDVMVPADLVMEVIERWRATDPEERIDLNIEERTGVSARWVYATRKKAEAGGSVPFDSVDRLITGLDLQHEWPRLMGAQEPEELTERHCRVCKREVLAEAVRPYKCVWCSKPTAALRKGYVYGPSHVSMPVLKQARELYDTGMTMRDVARQLGPLTRYRNAIVAERQFHAAFRFLGWPIRDRRADYAWNFRVGENWRIGSEALLMEAREHYESGYAMRQVVDIMWPRLPYASKLTARSTFYTAFKKRGWPTRSVSEVTRNRNQTHGLYSAYNEKKDPSHPQHQEYLDFKKKMWREQSRRGRGDCQHPGCSHLASGKYRGRKKPKGHPDYCRRHDPGAKARRQAGMAKRAQNEGQVDVATIRPILDAWKDARRLPRLAELSGMKVQTVYRWASHDRWPDGKLIKPEYAQAIRDVGLPSE